MVVADVLVRWVTSKALTHFARDSVGKLTTIDIWVAHQAFLAFRNASSTIAAPLNEAPFEKRVHTLPVRIAHIVGTRELVGGTEALHRPIRPLFGILGWIAPLASAGWVQRPSVEDFAINLTVVSVSRLAGPNVITQVLLEQIRASLARGALGLVHVVVP